MLLLVVCLWFMSNSCTNLCCKAKAERKPNPVTLRARLDTYAAGIFCHPISLEIRQLYVSLILSQCHDGLPAYLVELMCDFEAYGYCTAGDCSFGIDIAQLFGKSIDTLSLKSNSEPSIELINFMLQRMTPLVSIGLTLLHITTIRGGMIDREVEKRVLSYMLLVGIMLVWHCDESKSRDFRSLKWAITFEFLSLLLRKLELHQIIVRCDPVALNAPLSLHCQEIQGALNLYRSLVKEFGRRCVE